MLTTMCIFLRKDFLGRTGHSPAPFIIIQSLMSIELLLKDKKKLKKITTAAFRTVDLDHSGFIEGN
jgi:hypothetical protein